MTVGIADMQVTCDPDAVIETYGLGSCIAVCLVDPTRQVAGMIHYMLPLSKISPRKAAENPAMFADTGVPRLFGRMFELGSRREDLVVKVVGGGSFNGTNGSFDIGRRNYTVLRKLLWKNGVLVAGEDVGGEISRTVQLYVGEARVLIRAQGTTYEL